jgi:hypothetical protein
MEDVWEELDALCRELLPAEGTEDSDLRDRLRTQRETFRAAAEALDRHLHDLAAEAALAQVRDRLLAGMGVLQHLSFELGLERRLALVWPAAADPRSELSGTAGEYAIEVRLWMGEDGRARVRVTGQKRLEAVLPVSREKFRGALLSAVRAPLFTRRPSEAEATRPAEAASPPSSGTGTPAGAEAPSAASGDRPVPPPDDTPIPMGPAGAAEPAATPPPEAAAPQRPDGAPSAPGEA